MVGKESLFFLFLCGLCGMGSVLGAMSLSGPKHDKVMMCYVASWAANRPGAGKFLIEDVDPSLCTHLVYAFANLDDKNLTIMIRDPWQDINNGNYRKLVSLKNRYPHLKVMIGVGGHNARTNTFSKMAANRENRKKFIESVMVFLDQYKFDGVDLVWNYPTFASSKDKGNYVHLAKELSENFQPKGYILTASISILKFTMDDAYDLPMLNQYLDHINVMSFDYHGAWEQHLGHNAPLKGDTSYDIMNVISTIKYMLSHGVSPSKLVLGLALYGKSFILKEFTYPLIFDKSSKYNTEVLSSGPKGPYSDEPGFMGYNEICEEMTNRSTNWKLDWDAQSSTPILRVGKRVISYDNARSLAIKVKTAIDYSLGGFMVWSLDTDDFRGVCDRDFEEQRFIDFEERYRKLQYEPALDEALEYLDLPNQNTSDPIYFISNGGLYLQVPEPKYTKYPLMHTINEAITLATQEKRILDEMKVTHKKEWPVEVETEEAKPDSSHRAAAGAAVLLCALISLVL